jgi:polyisoprenoid-binding protein YceI
MRSPFAPVLLAVIALIAALARWAWQGSGNLYTALDKRFYVADPDLGWRISPTQPIWIGLEVCAVILAIAVGLAVGGFILRKLERRRGRTLVVLRVLAWAVAAVPLVVPIAAFASGGPPANARESLPPSQAVVLETGISGALDAPRGTYTVVAHAGSVVTAKLTAGGEAFDARFTGATGTLRFDPRALGDAIRADVRVPAASIDTGIGERSKHARDAYLLSAQHPHVTFALDKLVAARQDSPSVVAFRASGQLGLIGKTHAIEVIGTISKPDAVALTRLGLDGTALIVNAQFSIAIADTALAPDANDFDGARIPVQITLIVKHTGEIES